MQFFSLQESNSLQCVKLDVTKLVFSLLYSIIPIGFCTMFTALTLLYLYRGQREKGNLSLSLYSHSDLSVQQRTTRVFYLTRSLCFAAYATVCPSPPILDKGKAKPASVITRTHDGLSLLSKASACTYINATVLEATYVYTYMYDTGKKESKQRLQLPPKKFLLKVVVRWLVSGP